MTKVNGNKTGVDPKTIAAAITKAAENLVASGWSTLFKQVVEWTMADNGSRFNLVNRNKGAKDAAGKPVKAIADAASDLIDDVVKQAPDSTRKMLADSTIRRTKSQFRNAIALGMIETFNGLNVLADAETAWIKEPNAKLLLQALNDVAAKQVDEKHKATRLTSDEIKATVRKKEAGTTTDSAVWGRAAAAMEKVLLADGVDQETEEWIWRKKLVSGVKLVSEEMADAEKAVADAEAKEKRLKDREVLKAEQAALFMPVTPKKRK